MAKRRSTRVSSTAKRVRTEAASASETVAAVDDIIPDSTPAEPPSNATVLAALEGLTYDIRALTQRQTDLEKQLSATDPRSQPSTAAVQSAPINPVQELNRVTLGGGFGSTSNLGLGPHHDFTTAPTPAVQGRVPLSSVPKIDLIPKPIKDAILEFKDVNLSVLLLSMDYVEARCYQSGKPEKAEKHYLKLLSDARAARPLTLTEFVKGFSTYKRVMLEKHPQRQIELDAYERDIIEMATMFPGYGYYDYHRRFAAKAAAAWANLKIPVDWSVRDHSIFSEVFAGSRANRCKHCQSMLHVSESCAMTIKQKGSTYLSPQYNSGQQSSVTDRRGRQKLFHNGQEVCNNFNMRFCVRSDCNFAHVCLQCLGPHPQKDCNAKPANHDDRNPASQVPQPQKPGKQPGRGPLSNYY